MLTPCRYTPLDCICSLIRRSPPVLAAVLVKGSQLFYTHADPEIVFPRAFADRDQSPAFDGEYLHESQIALELQAIALGEIIHANGVPLLSLFLAGISVFHEFIQHRTLVVHANYSAKVALGSRDTNVSPTQRTLISHIVKQLRLVGTELEVRRIRPQLNIADLPARLAPLPCILHSCVLLL